MITLLVAAFVGELLSFALLWSYGALIAFLSAQLCGAFTILLTGLLLSCQSAQVERTQRAAVRPFFRD